MFKLVNWITKGGTFLESILFPAIRLRLHRTCWNSSVLNWLELLGTGPTVARLHGIGSKQFQGLC